MRRLFGFKDARRILHRERAQIAFLIGNGINLLSSSNQGLSWDGLMEQLIDDAAESTAHARATKARLKQLLKRGATGQTPASLPEVFDILDAVRAGEQRDNLSQEKDSLQGRIAELLGSMRPGEAHRALTRWARANKSPILTTNYDHCFQDALEGEKCQQRRFGSGKPKSDYYPWDRYYSPTSINDPSCGFAIWHVHGDRALKRSIRAGLDQYMGMAQRLRKLKQPIAKEVLRTSSVTPENFPAFHDAPWLRVFMGRKLFIQGLGLRAAEVSLRWLLIQRFRYWNRYCREHVGPTGWYIHCPTNHAGRLDQERRVFLENVGLGVIEIKTTAASYEKLYCLP